MRIRRLDPAAAAGCAALEAEVFAGESPWSEAAFAAELAHPGNLYLGVLDEAEPTRVLAYAGIARRGPAAAPEYEIHTIAVAPALRGAGLGRRLMEGLLAAADEAPGEVFLEVRVGNAPAIGLYESLGFTRLGRRRGYYGPGGPDAWTMRRAPAG
ncbi:hypothetical protein CSPHI_02150 [Corynebacterium sphenisci DSM 44792]|uniref:[Ribosomal protein bS18]-alanine N-acetyltransferase n=1 Tax=Corynebacterium sphenisci DSM 44792 TaxID=1437874 RepID=A0A1L7CW46_9CORY|nr:ribosomal protein S18-alanine N-acetyltransferase [Corynebacterium sphenisci]APT90073.1 hypothetical protein CSPHI_02150 [Corynebacterium sphenisci DSM 44792]